MKICLNCVESFNMKHTDQLVRLSSGRKAIKDPCKSKNSFDEKHCGKMKPSGTKKWGKIPMQKPLIDQPRRKSDDQHHKTTHNCQ